LSEHFDNVFGFDIDQSRVNELQEGYDRTNEVETERLNNSGLKIKSNVESIAQCTTYIVTVPTPTNADKTPDLTPMLSASKMLGNILNKGDLVIYESTVYPGVTEDSCAPVLEKISGLVASHDFFLGYSPERINPGDKIHTVDKIHKIVAGDTPKTLQRVAAIYEPIISAGIHRAESIKVAEAAKVIENTQRDINIAMMNELSKICDKIGISTRAVIEAAGTKWNFHKYTPGLVGGHCIGVDPYYLASLAQRVDLNPEVILSGRRLNDSMHKHVAHKVLRMITKNGLNVSTSKIALLGMTFKQNCPDLRNSRSFSLLDELQSFGCKPLVHDAEADIEELKKSGIQEVDFAEVSEMDLIILAVGHDDYIKDGLIDRIKPGGMLVDIQNVFYGKEVRSDIEYWAL
jgi:UDP-N-acetyl-D-galactosamine dehydrogenase